MIKNEAINPKKPKEKYEMRLISGNEWEILLDIRKLEFGEVIIFIQNNYPYRKEVKESKKIKQGKLALDKGS